MTLRWADGAQVDVAVDRNAGLEGECERELRRTLEVSWRGSVVDADETCADLGIEDGATLAVVDERIPVMLEARICVHDAHFCDTRSLQFLARAGDPVVSSVSNAVALSDIASMQTSLRCVPPPAAVPAACRGRVAYDIPLHSQKSYADVYAELGMAHDPRAVTWKLRMFALTWDAVR